MNQTTDAPPPTPAPDPPPTGYAGDTVERVLTRLKSLRRSRSERVFAWVCGGVARGLGLDPLFVRVLVAVLALVGGAGVVLYAVGWLLLPEDDGTRSLAERAATGRREPGSRRPLVLSVVLVLITLIAASTVFDRWDGPLLLVLAVVALALWIDRRTDRAPALPPAAPRASLTPTPGVATDVARGVGPGVPSAPAVQDGPGPAGSGATPPPTVYSQPIPPFPRPEPRPRSVLFAATISCVVIALGILGAVDSAGGRVAADAYPALALAMVGAGLVVGAWVGRSRGLIVVGLLLALATASAVGAERVGGTLSDDRVDVNLRPTTVAALPTSVEYGVGNATYDLLAIDFTGAAVTSSLSIGAGEIVVIVPRDVDVTAAANIGVGQADLFGQESGGPGVQRTVTDLGADGPGGGTLDLTLDAGVGHLEVRRG